MKDRKGFTLIEIIFSVAFLSIVSVIMLRLLFASFDLELKTDTMDVASVQLMSLIETVKAENETQPGDLVVYYDDQWQLVDREEARFEVKVSKKRNIKYFGVLYDIFGSVGYVDGETLMRIETKHYYGKE